MKEKCFNYKFFLMLLLPILVLSLGIMGLVFGKGTDVFWWAFFTILIDILSLVNLFFTEPIYYIINEEGIKVVCCFKYYFFSWDQIKNIKIFYDSLVSRLLVKDYVLYFYSKSGKPQRHERILKYRKTKRLIERYYGSFQRYNK